MTLATILGYPRLGPARELKFGLEKYWKGQIDAAALLSIAADLRAQTRGLQRAAGLTSQPTGDFSLYDRVLDMAALFGVVPSRYGWQGGDVDLDTYFAMARGVQRQGLDVPAAEMTKWFDTNYHYIVPEFSRETTFTLCGAQPLDALTEALAEGIAARPVLVGPVTFLALGKRDDGVDPLTLLDALLPAYAHLLTKLEKAGATCIQLDEPLLVMDLTPAARAAFAKAYDALRAATSAKLFVTTPFGALEDNLDLALRLPIDVLHLDMVRGASQLIPALEQCPAHLSLALGVVDGRNIWRNDLDLSLGLLERAADKLGGARVWTTTSCSLVHAPYDLSLETAMDPEIKSWMAFARQKLDEVACLAKGLSQGRAAIESDLKESNRIMALRRRAPRIHNPAVKARTRRQPLETARRPMPFPERRVLQRDKLCLPLFPTTTIGSFPQTGAVRKARADFKKGKIDQEGYNAFLQDQIKGLVAFQTEVGLDVLVHGEFERNDMVEYFGEQLDGFVFTEHGWVQSYGSRGVKPPIIYGDVARPRPMTVAWSAYAQSLTPKPVKGMLTGPVTILQWSFVRDDQPRAVTAHQIALALQDEAKDLETAGLRVIQVDEPAFREGLPLRRAAQGAYLSWAAAVFRLVGMPLAPATQLHTHMCYSAFNDIIESIKDLDADVISIETSRSHMELLDAFVTYKYPAEIGPGVYDIHSPRVPSADEMIALLEKAATRLDPEQIWVNPDCGLKTRDWPETKASLQAMVAAARAMRAKYKSLRA